MSTSTRDAADVWHEDPDHDITAGVIRREVVRQEWPELGSALDAMPPSDIRQMMAEPKPLVRAIRPIPRTEHEVVHVHLKPNYGVIVGYVASLLVGISLGLAIQFAILSPAVTR